jgi:integrase
MARRKNGRGAVFQRADGRWEGQLRLPAGGRKCFYGRSRRTKLEQGGWLLAQGPPVSSRQKSVGAFLDEWLEVTRRRVRPSTFENYELNVRRLNRFFADLPVGRLSPPAIQEAYRRLEVGGLSPYSVLQAHRTLHRALNQAFHWGLIRANPAALVFPPRPPKREMTALRPDQLNRLFTSTRGTAIYPILVVLGTAGLRIGEVLGLRWEDVDLDSNRIIVRRTLRRHRGRGLVFAPCKTPRSYRTVVLTELAVAALREHRMRRVSGSSSGDAMVFANTLNGPIDPGTLRRHITRALSVAGLPAVRVHDLRHTAASALLVAGVHPKVVQDILGHSTIRVTLDTYSHVMPGLHEAAATQLDALLRELSRIESSKCS